MARAALNLLLRAARAIVEPSAASGSIEPSLDLPVLLHLASQHRLRCAVLDALLADPGSAASAGGRDGITLEDLKARRLAIAARNLAIISNSRRMLALFDRCGVKAALKPNPGVGLMTAGVSGYELSRADILIHPDDLPAAEAAVMREGWPNAQVSIDATVPQPGFPTAADLAAALARAIDVSVEGGSLRVLAFDDQLAALSAGDVEGGSRRLDHLVAIAALRREPLDITRAGAILAASVGTTIDGARAPRRSRGSAREIWIAGFPSRYGGADTELDHLIDLLRLQHVDVHLVPMFDVDGEMRATVVERGCHIHDYTEDVFKDKVVASFCNGQFLGHLDAIARAGRPATVVWFNCMTWLFDAEKTLHQQGLLDVFGFQSQYQRNMLLPLLEPIAPVRSFPYRPFFNARRVEWRYRDWEGTYRVGRISRDDQAKFPADTWQMFDRIEVPGHLRKAVHILGYGYQAATKIGPPPEGLDTQLWAPAAVSSTEFFRSIDTMIHKTGGSRESSSRVLFEAYAHGVVPIVERDFAFPELVVHGETGFMATNGEEMSEYASLLAANPREHRRLAENGRSHLEECLAQPEACFAPWESLLD